MTIFVEMAAEGLKRFSWGSLEAEEVGDGKEYQTAPDRSGLSSGRC